MSAGASLLHQQITLGDIIDPEALERVCETFSQLLGTGVTVLDHKGNSLVPIESACLNAAGPEGVEGGRCPLKNGNLALEELGERPEGTSKCPCGLRTTLARLDYQGHTMGYLVFGPVRASSEQGESGAWSQVQAPPTSDLGGALLRPAPLMSEALMVRAVGAAREVLSVIVQTGYARHLTSQIHIAAIQDAYNELIEKNRRLADSVEKLKELDQLKNSFLATVSHELRTPLTSIIGYTEMLLEQISGPLNEQQIQYLGTVMRKGDQLLQLINQILDISRNESGKVRLNYSDFELCDVLRDVHDTMIPQARRKHIGLAYETPERPLQMRADREKVRQILVNLLSNAIKFTKENGKVSMLARICVVERPSGETAMVELRVQDTGIGVPEEQRTRVFEAFYQVDNSATRQHGGTGLGLSLVKQYAEAHGGKVWVQAPAEGPGSVFVVLLPRNADRNDTSSPTDGTADPSLRQLPPGGRSASGTFTAF